MPKFVTRIDTPSRVQYRLLVLVLALFLRDTYYHNLDGLTHLIPLSSFWLWPLEALFIARIRNVPCNQAVSTNANIDGLSQLPTYTTGSSLFRFSIHIPLALLMWYQLFLCPALYTWFYHNNRTLIWVGAHLHRCCPASSRDSLRYREQRYSPSSQTNTTPWRKI